MIINNIFSFLLYLSYSSQAFGGDSDILRIPSYLTWSPIIPRLVL